MSRRTTILVIGGLVLVGQLIFFRDYISPIQWGQIKVTGLACTCPDESVLNGQFYLRSITPDSLKKYNLDYSEIYVTDRPLTKIDPMGVDYYMVTGQVIGKRQVFHSDTWNPIVRVDTWREINLVRDWATKVLFFGQMLILLLIARRQVKNGAQQRA